MGIGLLSLIPLGIWFWAAYQQGGEPFVNLMLEENTGRFFRKMSYESHENPLWYNFLTLIWGWIPWTLVLLVSLFGLKWKEMHVLPEGDSVGERLKKVWDKFRSQSPLQLFTWVVVLTIFIFYCIPKSKRSVYLLPIYPFMGMLIAEARRCIKTPLDDPYTEKMEKKEDFLFGSQQLIRIYLEQMLIYMIRRNSSPPMTVPVSQFVNLKNNSAVYKRVIAYMEDHIRENITLCDLCHDNMIGRSQLQKIFQEQHQCGAMDFFSRLKIAYARQLIRENQMNFTQISEFLGYSSIHYFSRQFKKISGMTPTEYITSIKALSERERQ